MNLFKSKKPSDFQQSAKTMGAVETLIKAGLLKININKYTAHINIDLQWNGKSKDWQNNFMQNLNHYINMKRALHNQDVKDLPLQVFNIETKELITEKKFEI